MNRGTEGNKSIRRCLVAICLAFNVGYGQCPEHTPDAPSLDEVAVEVSVDLDRQSGIFTYIYSLSHGGQSTGCVWRFELDVTLPPGADEPSDSGLVDFPRYVSRDPSVLQIAPEIIPVGFPDLPSTGGIPKAWSASITILGSAAWSSDFRQTQLEPGGRISGFVLTSRGLPGLRDFRVKPYFNPPPVPEGQFTPDLLEQLRQAKEAIIWRGETVAPTAPSAVFVPLEFMETLVSYKHRAVELGWIDNQGIANSLDAKLDNVKKQLKKGKTKTANNVLRAFLNEVEAQKDKHLSSEAYALLKFNGEFLLGKL